MNNFQSFVKDYQAKNPKSDFEKSFVKFTNDIKSIITGVKEMIVSNNKRSTPENATSLIKEFEKQREQEFDLERIDFSEVKDLLNDIKINTEKKDDERKSITYDNRDNFVSSDENEAKHAKFEFDLDKKMFELSREQLSVLKEIRDELKPRVPPELEEQKAKSIDLLAFLNEEEKNRSSMFDGFGRKDNSAVVAESGKKTQPKSKQSKLGRIMSNVGKVGLAATAALGAGYFIHDVYNQVKKEELDNKLKDIDIQLENGNISELQANSMKEELEGEYKRDLTKNISEDVGNISGTIGGGVLGAKLGSVAGPIGTIGGGILGSVIGGVAGSEAGKSVGEFLNDNNIDEIIDDTKKKAIETLESAKEKYNKAKDFIQTNLLPEASKKIESFVSTIKESINVDKIREKAASGLESLKEIIEPDTQSQASKIIGSQTGKFVTDSVKEIETTKDNDKKDDSKVFVNNVVNNQSNNNYIPMKATPRAEYVGSALDRYTDRLSSF